MIKDGAVIARHAWGFADLERRIRFTPSTLFRICSVTKQFTCALALDVAGDIGTLDAAIRSQLPGLTGAVPTAAQLAHNQSGLRDLWAVAMLHGSPAEAPFGDAETERILRTTRSLQFAPGTRYSYSNQNFRLLSNAVEAKTGERFAALLRRRVFDPAGMPTALVGADTAALPDGTTGYEGTQETGFRPAVNRIVWTGDAGIAASLDDMIAWEQFIDRIRDDPAGLYRRLTVPVAFADGAPAQYGFGLGRGTLHGRAVTGHGGALRGWRSHRLHSAADRLSVVVLFNHMGNAVVAAHELFSAAIGAAEEPESEPVAMPPIAGAYREPETGLSVRIAAGPAGKVALRYDRYPELLAIQPDGTVGSPDSVRLRPEGDGLWMDRATDHQSTRLVACAPSGRIDAAGTFRCAELDAELRIEDAGGVLYGAFAGFLGRGRMERLDAVAEDVWALPMPRALDHTPPGDWTLAVERDGSGGASAVTVGCWLARGLRYEAVG